MVSIRNISKKTTGICYIEKVGSCIAMEGDVFIWGGYNAESGENSGTLNPT
jgi:hypothetical protein